MDILNNIKYNKNYTEKINHIYDDCTLFQNVKNTKNLRYNKKTYKYIDELLYKEFNYFSILDIDTIDSVFMNIASNIDENTDKYYNKFQYNNKFSKSLIQRGLQEKNNISTLLYLGDLYEISFVIHIVSNNKYILLNDNDYKKVIIDYNNSHFSINNDNNIDVFYNYDIKTIKLLENIFNCNISNLNIYKNELKPISNYKVNELYELSKNHNIILYDNNGSKKNKTQLYYEINKKLRKINNNDNK